MVLPNENKLGISNLDTVAAFLSDKLVAGTNISLQVLNSGGNEQLEITSNNLTWKGEWSASEGYNINDLVTYLGVTYIAYDTVLPTDTEDFPDRPNITPSKWGSLISPVSPSITIGSVTTGAAGSSAVVTNSGTEAAPILNFIIPRGDKGTSGSAGTTGTSGNDGQAATITIGTVTTGLPNSAVSVQNVGTVTNAVFNFSIPKGEQGDAGDTGDTGAKGDAGTITVGTVTNPPAGSSVTVTNVGTSSDAILNFAIPKGYASDIVRTSTDSVTIGTGSKTFTYEHESFNIGYGLGSRLRVYYDSTHYMEGVVSSIVNLNTQVTITVDKAVGSGTWAVWNIVLAGQPVTQAELDAKVNVSDVVNTLTETNAGKVLDGRQGKVLSDAIALKANTSSLATVATTGAYADLLGKPTLATVATTGAYVDLLGKPTLATVATTGAYVDLSGKPTLATVATSGSYTDLSSKPTLGTAAALDVGTAANQVVQLTNDSKLPAVDGSLLTGITALPSQTSNNGKYLTTNGTVASWDSLTASDITVDTTNFNLNLSGTDTTVQLALETLDDLIAGAGGHTIQNEGTPLTARTNLNFIGTAVNVTDNSGADSTDVTINLPTTGSGLILGTWDDSGTFTSGVRFDGSADKVILPQATTAERTAITPLASELIYDTNLNQFFYGDGTTVGGKAVGSTTVADNVFRIQDNTDATKQIAFEASGITTGTTRTLTPPDASGTIALIDTTGIADKDLFYYNASSKLFKRIAIGTTDQALIAKPSLDPPYQWGTVASSGGRELLTANRTYYVRTDGSDSNNGLTNTAGGAFLTISKFFDTLVTLDKNGFSVSCNVADGTYSITQSIIIKDGIGEGEVFLTGNTATPSNCLITSPSDIKYLVKNSSGTIEIKGFKFTNTGNSANTIFIQLTDGVTAIGNLEFGATTTGAFFEQFHLHVSGKAILYKIGNYTISGSATYHEFITVNGMIRDYLNYNASGNPITVTVIGNPSFYIFNYTRYGGVYDVFFIRQIFSGSATGTRYACDSLGGIFTSGGGANYFPGSLPGSSNGGFYS